MRKFLWIGSLLGGSVATAAVLALSYFGSHPGSLIARCSGLLPGAIGQPADDTGADCGIEMCAPDEPCPASELPERPEPIVVYQNGRETQPDRAGAFPPESAELLSQEAASQGGTPAGEFEEQCYRVMPPCAEDTG